MRMYYIFFAACKSDIESIVGTYTNIFFTVVHFIVIAIKTGKVEI